MEEVIEYRKMDDGSLEFHLRWRGTPVTTWEQSKNVKHVLKVKEFCSEKHLPAPGTEEVRKAVVAVGGARGRLRVAPRHNAGKK